MFVCAIAQLHYNCEHQNRDVGISELVRSRCKSEAEEELEPGDAESQFLSSIKYVSCNFIPIYFFLV